MPATTVKGTHSGCGPLFPPTSVYIAIPSSLRCRTGYLDIPRARLDTVAKVIQALVPPARRLMLNHVQRGAVITQLLEATLHVGRRFAPGKWRCPPTATGAKKKPVLRRRFLAKFVDEDRDASLQSNENRPGASSECVFDDMEPGRRRHGRRFKRPPCIPHRALRTCDSIRQKARISEGIDACRA